MEPPVHVHTFTTEADWLDARHQRITASDCAVIMGSPKHHEWSRRDDPGVDPVIALWRKKTHPRTDRPKSIVMRMGLALEPLVGQLWEELNPGWQLVEPYLKGEKKLFGFHCRGADGWASASLDWLPFNKESGELKVVDGKTGMYGRGNFMETYFWAERWQMYCADVDHAELACLQKAKGEFWIERIERHKGYSESAMVLRCAEFRTFVVNRQEPPMDWIYPPEF